MKKDREELTRIHKEKCRELKEIRARIAADLGVELNQRECTYKGYCSGTCPACKSEEIRLNAAIVKKQAEGMNLKGRMTAAGLAAAAALCLSGCTVSKQEILEGDTQLPDTPSVTTAPESDMSGQMVEPGQDLTVDPALDGETGNDASGAGETGQKDTPEDCTAQYETEGDYELSESRDPQEDGSSQAGYEIQGEIIPDMDGPDAEDGNG